jgi:hypothetical protein
MHEEPGVAGEWRAVKPPVIGYAPHCGRRRPPRPRHTEPPQCRGPAQLSKVRTMMSSRSRDSRSDSRSC